MNDTGPQVIATRTYLLDGNALTVSLFQPYLHRPGFYRCEYAIVTETKTIHHYVEGLDEIDVVICALAMIGTNVSGLNEAIYHGRLHWVAGESGDIGLPTIDDHWPFKKASQ